VTFGLMIGVFMLGLGMGMWVAAGLTRGRRSPRVSPYCRVCGRKLEVSAWPVRADPETGRAERYEVRTECPAFHAEGAGNTWQKVSPEDLERIRVELAADDIVVKAWG